MISIHIRQVKVNRLAGLMVLLITLFFSCKKKDTIGEDPYGGGKLPLGVSFADPAADAGTGVAGDVVTIRVKGLLKYQGKFDFLINETKAEVVEMTDSTLNVKVPENASTGGVSILLDGQTFFGPKFNIEGKVSRDVSFKVQNGTNGTISDIFSTPDGNYLLVGNFSNFEGKAALAPVNGIVLISRNGEFQSSLQAQKGSTGFIQSITQREDGKYMVGGLFTSFNNRKGIFGITRLNSNGSLDTAVVNVINLTPLQAEKGRDTVAAFNGGVDGSILTTFVRDNKITAIGNFNNYAHIFYERSTRDTKVLDVTKMNSLVRMKEDGTMDSTFNFNPVTRQGYAGVNGEITDALMQADGKIIIAGKFTSYNGSAVSNIARVNTDGSLDQTFKVGSGADDGIISMRVNKLTNKIMLAGLFKSFNGIVSDGVVMLNADGAVDGSFKFGAILGGRPSFAAQLNNGKIVVSGGFNKYNNIIRQGFMILNADGTLAGGYNNTGAFQGQIWKLVETTSALGNPAIIIVGSIYKFDNQRVGNIVRIEIKP